MKYLLLVLLGVVWGGEISHQLSEIPTAERGNISIYLASQNPDVSKTLKDASELWNIGSYEKAIKLIKGAEQVDPDIILGEEYREPSSTIRWGNEVLLNQRPWKSRNLELVYEPNTGNLFMAIKADTGTGSSKKYFAQLFFSNNGGETWSRTASWTIPNGTKLNSYNIAELDTFIYMVQAWNGRDVFFVRYNANTGHLDNSFGAHYVISPSDTIKEIVIEPNRYFHNRLYIAFITMNHNLSYYYSANPYTTWQEINTGVTNAYKGLDASYGYTPSSGHYIWLSYINTNDSLDVLARTDGSWDTHLGLSAAEPYPTSIAMHGDTVIVLFAYQYASHVGIRYKITYNDGGNWYYGTFNATNDTVYVSDVTGNGNNGWNVIYTSYHYLSASEDVKYLHRGYGSGQWSSPLTLNSHDAMTTYKPVIEYVGGGHYGTGYIADNYDVYFNRSDWVDVAEPPVNVEKPFSFMALTKGRVATLEFTLKTSGIANVRIYNVSGSLIKSYTVSAHAGVNRIAFNARVPGVYIARLEFKGEVVGTKFVLVK